MSDISAIPLDELLEDRAASVSDCSLCQFFVATWPDHVKAAEYQERGEANQRIIETIDAELARRITTETTP